MEDIRKIYSNFNLPNDDYTLETKRVSYYIRESKFLEKYDKEQLLIIFQDALEMADDVLIKKKINYIERTLQELENLRVDRKDVIKLLNN